jgi:hypothetical protein
VSGFAATPAGDVETIMHIDYDPMIIHADSESIVTETETAEGERAIEVVEGGRAFTIVVGQDGYKADALPALLGLPYWTGLGGIFDWVSKAIGWVQKHGPAIKSIFPSSGMSAMRRKCEASGPTPECCAWAINPPVTPGDPERYCPSPSVRPMPTGTRDPEPNGRGSIEPYLPLIIGGAFLLLLMRR